MDDARRRHGHSVEQVRPRVRLAVYLELAYRRDEAGYSADRAFVRFLLALREHVESLRLIGRVDPEPGRAPYSIPDDVEVVALPHYPTLQHVGALVRAVPATLPAVWRSLDDVDAVWAIGPHPMSLPVALAGLARRRRVALGVRQDFPEYVRHRLPSRRWLPAVGAAHVLEAGFKVLARRVPVLAVGPELAGRYRGRVLELAVSLLPEQEVAAEPPPRPPLDGRPVELLSVGRLDPEKAPALLLEAVERLEGSFRLTIVGTGKLADELAAGAARLGDRVRLLGYVPHGPELFDLFRRSDVLVHTARTEGLPQVLIEAQAFGLPIVATDVGGVRGAVGDAALLVPPGDAGALADAVRRLAGDDALRARLTRLGRERTRELTLERQAARVAAFLSK